MAFCGRRRRSRGRLLRGRGSPSAITSTAITSSHHHHKIKTPWQEGARRSFTASCFADSEFIIIISLAYIF